MAWQQLDIFYAENLFKPFSELLETSLCPTNTSLNKKQTQFICTCMKRYSILVNDHQALTEGTGPMLFFLILIHV